MYVFTYVCTYDCVCVCIRMYVCMWGIYVLTVIISSFLLLNRGLCLVIYTGKINSMRIYSKGGMCASVWGTLVSASLGYILTIE